MITLQFLTTHAYEIIAIIGLVCFILLALYYRNRARVFETRFEYLEHTINRKQNLLQCFIDGKNKLTEQIDSYDIDLIMLIDVVKQLEEFESYLNGKVKRAEEEIMLWRKDVSAFKSEIASLKARAEYASYRGERGVLLKANDLHWFGDKPVSKAEFDRLTENKEHPVEKPKPVIKSDTVFGSYRYAWEQAEQDKKIVYEDWDDEYGYYYVKDGFVWYCVNGNHHKCYSKTQWLIDKTPPVDEGWRVMEEPETKPEKKSEAKPEQIEGSREWAKRMLLEGKRVFNVGYHDGDRYFVKNSKQTIDILFKSDNSAHMEDYDIEHLAHFQGGYFSFSTGWQIYTEPQPETKAEPKPKFAGVKVGDTVEIEAHETIMHIKVDIVNDRFFGDNPFTFKYDGTAYDEVLKFNKAIRIVPASEVIVDFGSFRGTIESAKFNNITHVHNNKSVATIPLDMLTPEKQAEVKALLQQMEVERD